MSRAQKQPYVRFFPSDWLGGTRGMKAAEIGVYITLIMMMYERCEPIPDDDRRLARQCGADLGAYRAAKAMLLEAEKIIVEDAGLWNRRVDAEFKWRAENSEAARAAAEKRWEKEKGIKGPRKRAQCDRNAGGMLKPEAQKPYREDTASAASSLPREADRMLDRIRDAARVDLRSCGSGWWDPSLLGEYQAWKGLGLTDEAILTEIRRIMSKRPEAPTSPRFFLGAMKDLARHFRPEPELGADGFPVDMPADQRELVVNLDILNGIRPRPPGWSFDINDPKVQAVARKYYPQLFTKEA